MTDPSPFGKPSETEGSGRQFAELEGSLVIFQYGGTGEAETKQYGVKPYVAVNAFVVEGVEAGTKSRMPAQTFGAEPKTLENLTGEVVNNMRIFQGFVRTSFRNCQPGALVLARVAVEGKKTAQSKDDKDLKASWVLVDPTPAEEQKAASWWMQNKPAGPFVPPSTASAPAASAAPAQDEEPPF